ncbi:unnamed protein product [Prorocentrum cordatum]|uniref:Uncharacterized protein n=1 Tax=Prorocentrum cordatum TaxID=2364126 RepID=A0ABN9QTI6_9DINO|nr:unnamed protein product [Polarella glacialis]
MQTVQCFATGNRSNLQRLRDNLQDLPKRWLQPRSDSQEDVFLGNVQGECNYRFTFRLEGGGFFQTGVLVASAETFQGGLPVPLRCKWKRKVGDLPVDIPGVTSNMYQARGPFRGRALAGASAAERHLALPWAAAYTPELEPEPEFACGHLVGGH